MTINIQYQQMPASEALSERITRNLHKLNDKYNFVIHARVLFRQENDSTGQGKVCEVELSGPGPRIFAKSDTDDFEKAAAATLNDLERQLRKQKEKFDKRKKSVK